MRLFIAINFDEKTKGLMALIQHRLRELSPHALFPPVPNFHLTLAFLGEVEEDSLIFIHQAIKETSFAPTRLIFDSIGQFNRKEGPLVWLGIKENSQLAAAQKQLAHHLKQAGFTLQNKPYIPHITLARKTEIKEGIDLNSLLSSSFSALADEMDLMESIKIDGKLVYTKIGP